MAEKNRGPTKMGKQHKKRKTEKSKKRFVEREKEQSRDETITRV